VNALMFVWPHPSVSLAGRTVGLYDLGVSLITVGLVVAFVGALVRGLLDLADVDA